MKKILLLLSILLISFYGFSQKKASSILLDNAIKKYHLSLSYLDYQTAISAVQDILIIAPEKTNYKDTLLALYYNSNLSYSAVLLAKEMEKEGNTNISVLEVLATMYQKAGNLKESLAYYEKIYEKTNKLYYLYQLAIIQFNMSRINECMQSLTKILEDPNSLKETIRVDYEKANSQEVLFAAAAYNILGVLSINLNKPDVATQYFNKSLEIYPEFLLAKNNLSSVSQK